MNNILTTSKKSSHKEGEENEQRSIGIIDRIKWL